MGWVCRPYDSQLALGDYGPMGIQVLKIIWINILLSGDNAVVIALACRALPPRQRSLGHHPRRRRRRRPAHRLHRRSCNTARDALAQARRRRCCCSGSPSSCWSQDEATRAASTARDNLWGAVRTVAIADIVMSLDNVLAIAAAARGITWLIVFGLAVSIPLIVAGATLIMALLHPFPVLVWAGAGASGLDCRRAADGGPGQPALPRQARPELWHRPRGHRDRHAVPLHLFVLLAAGC